MKSLIIVNLCRVMIRNAHFMDVPRSSPSPKANKCRWPVVHTDYKRPFKCLFKGSSWQYTYPIEREHLNEKWQKTVEGIGRWWFYKCGMMIPLFLVYLRWWLYFKLWSNESILNYGYSSLMPVKIIILFILVYLACPFCLKLWWMFVSIHVYMGLRCHQYLIPLISHMFWCLCSN